MGRENVAEAAAIVMRRVAAAAERSGRDPAEVRVVAVTKEADVAQIEAAIDAGVTDFGENYAKELRAKAEAVAGDVTWHFLGPIQRNKVRFLDRVRLLHGLQRVEEAEALQARAEALGRTWDVLVQVNIAAEPQKQGVGADQVEGLLEALAPYRAVRPRGLMFVAPQVENVEDVRAMFAEARALRERFASLGLEELSMGMTDDFEVAVEEGSTIVRIGRAIFRPEDT